MLYILQATKPTEYFPLTIMESIQLAGVLVAISVGLISIAISIITLRQNRKMIESSTRPYIIISFDVLRNGSPVPYFVLKNYGSTGATLTSFEFSDSLKCVTESYLQQFENIPGLFLAPQQSKIFYFPVFAYEIKEATFTYSYTNNIHTYTEKIVLKTQLHNFTSSVSNEDFSVARHLGQITKNIEELVRRTL